MNKQQILEKISALHEKLKNSVLAPADAVAIRNEIGELEDKISLLDFYNDGGEHFDYDYGYHSQWE